ncbi:thioredoxin domain-containing protein [Glaciihabitans sp. dw_435]|uniref:thioredoxin domain-containing protein n=1 Tax=Glaciihabitans sp. dw_435 TaxID=2720081 RepID=UPI001BD1FEA3|nr:DUF255 domain-containing protein [Glaciihabitans sp. dw_435]
MPNRLATAVSPYLRSHADNPVDWQQWGPDPFAEAVRRQAPVLISIGYSTCHWCHVMARETFSDPVLAGYLNENFVAVKVDREEYPDVDSSYLASAGAFTEQLGWPLTIFATPEGKTFFAGTYFPPVPVQGRPSFRQVLDAVLDAWTQRRTEVDSNAAQIATALAAQGSQKPGPLPRADDFAAIVSELTTYEDGEFAGFGGAPKFPVATVIGMLLDRETVGDARAGALARRMLTAMADSELRDPVEGGFFRYAVRRDWTEPHYERMLYDNALLLSAYARIDRVDIADGIASFLLTVMRLPSGGFASAQDSESTVDGARVEGGYYALDAEARAGQVPPALDEKVLTGWNGLAIEALATSGSRLGRQHWIDAARETAEYLSAGFAATGTLPRARIGQLESSARPTLEDYGMLAAGLVAVALATGEADYATRARDIVDASLSAAAPDSQSPFGVPGGADPVLTGHGLALAVDPSEGAYPSGLSAISAAALALHRLSGEGKYLAAATRAMELLAPLAVQRPISFGAALGVMSALDAGARQLVVVTGSGADASADVTALARRWDRSGSVVSVVNPEQAASLADAGFELYEGRSTRDGLATAYLCEDFVCQLPVTDAESLAALLA